MPAHDCEILPHRSMFEKLPNECVSIRPGFRKQQDPGRVAIDAMYDKRPLSLFFQLCRKKRQGGWRTGVLRRHRQKLSWFIEGYDGIVFVEHGKFPGEARLSAILPSGILTAMAWELLHGVDSLAGTLAAGGFWATAHLVNRVPDVVHVRYSVAVDDYFESR